MLNYTSPFRLQIIEALTTKLKTIAPTNGYQMDLSGDGCVVRGRMFLGDDEPPAMVSILEPPVAIEPMKQQSENRDSAGAWDLLIQGWAQDPINDPSAHPCDLAYVLAHDVRRMLYKLKTENKVRSSPRGDDILGFGPKIHDWKVGVPVVRPSEEVSGYGVFYMLLTMKIVEDLS
jgi:hypothetical protein